MKIVIENRKFEFDLGCRLLKTKHGNKCPFDKLEDFWDEIKPMTFLEIAQLANMEERRIGIFCLGIEKLVAEVNPILLDKQTISKTTTWVLPNGEIETKNYDDTYELFKVSADYFNVGFTNSWEKLDDSYFVKCKDTSTDRQYLIWVDLNRVLRTNNEHTWNMNKEKDTNAIQAIAWTIQTNIKKGDIKEIIRQGDCIMIKPIRGRNDRVSTRHLTEKEYRKFIIAES